jgi:hypothetical protein
MVRLVRHRSWMQRPSSMHDARTYDSWSHHRSPPHGARPGAKHNDIFCLKRHMFFTHIKKGEEQL